MRKISRKIVVLVMCLSLVLCSLQVYPQKQEVKAYTAHTKDDAIAWAKSKVGQRLEGDNVYGSCAYQCVDFIMCYYKYLGVSPSSGNGKDYASNALPSGWTRVKGGQPQKGDILVYSGNSGNTNGHVAIYESERSTYHQNFGNCQKVTHETYKYNGLTVPYWGYIRPDWTTGHNPFGVVDECKSVSAGKLSLRGWAIDKDNYGAQLDIHVYVGPENSATGYNIGAANTERSDVDNVYHCGKYHGFDKVIDVNKTGWQRVRVYAINVGGGNNRLLYDNTVYIQSDTEKPEILSYNISGLNEKGYKIRVYCKDNKEVTKVNFGIKSTDGDSGQVLYEGSCTAKDTESAWEFTFTEGNPDKKYTTKVYAYDAAGNCESIELEPIKIGKDTEKPVVKSSKIYQDEQGVVNWKLTVSDNYGLGKMEKIKCLWFSEDENSDYITTYNHTIMEEKYWAEKGDSQQVILPDKTTEVKERVTCDGIVGWQFWVWDLAYNGHWQMTGDRAMEVKSSHVQGDKECSEEIILKKGETVKLSDIVNDNWYYHWTSYDKNNERIVKKVYKEEEDDTELTGNEEGIEYIYFENIAWGGIYSCKIIVVPNEENTTVAVHAHDYKMSWSNDETNHWNECQCGDRKNVEKHSFVWKTDRKATQLKSGQKHKECSICGYSKEYTEIPKLTSNKTMPNSSVNVKKPIVTQKPSTKSHKVTAPGKITKLTAKNKKKKSVTLTWKKGSGAKGYQIQYASNKKFAKQKSKLTTKMQYTVKKLKKKKTYYFRVRAFKLNGKKKVYGKWSGVKKVKIKK